MGVLPFGIDGPNSEPDPATAAKPPSAAQRRQVRPSQVSGRLFFLELMVPTVNRPRRRTSEARPSAACGVKSGHHRFRGSCFFALTVPTVNRPRRRRRSRLVPRSGVKSGHPRFRGRCYFGTDGPNFEPASPVGAALSGICTVYSALLLKKRQYMGSYSLIVRGPFCKPCWLRFAERIPEP